MNGFEKRSQQKKQQILTATYNLLNTPTGVARVTTADIVKASGVSKATIFKYFGSKEKLLQQVYLDFLDQVGDQALAFVDQPLSFEEKMVAMTQVKINNFDQVEQQFFIDLMDFYTQKEDLELAAKMAAYQKKSTDTLMDLFYQGRKEGKIDLKYSDEFLLLYVEAMIKGVSDPAVYPKIQVHNYTEYWSEMLLKSLAPKNTDSKN